MNANRNTTSGAGKRSAQSRSDTFPVVLPQAPDTECVARLDGGDARQARLQILAPDHMRHFAWVAWSMVPDGTQLLLG
jgi:hypothetical protein